MCSIHIGGIAMINESYSLIIATTARMLFVAYAPVAQTEERILSKNEVLVQLHSGAVYDLFL